MSIVKTYTDKKAALNEQFQNIISENYGSKAKRVSVRFTAANKTALADFGFRVTSWSVVDNESGIGNFRRMAVDNRYLHLRADGAGTIIVEGR